MSRILITGATGFVGRALCQELLKRGHTTVAAVRQRFRAAVLPPEVEVLETGDIGPDTRWQPSWFEGVDAIVHLAARVHVLKERASEPLAEFRRVNVAGSVRLAEAAAGHVRRFVYVSSLHAMCTLTDSLLEETTPCRPDTPYGQSKWEAEQSLRQLAGTTGLELVIVRPPPVYGPGSVGNLRRLLEAVSRGWPLPLGGLANRRSLIYVNNLAHALATCVEAPEAAGNTFLVSDGEDLSISELVRRAGTALGRRARLLPAPVALMRVAGRLSGRSAAVERLFGSLAVDCGKIRQHLKWHPPHTLNEGLRMTAQSMERVQ